MKFPSPCGVCGLKCFDCEGITTLTFKRFRPLAGFVV